LKVMVFTMKTCKRCNVKVLDNTNNCPLCRSVLTDYDGVTADNIYPAVDVNVRRYNIIARIFLFLSIVGGITAIVTNYLTYNGILWSILTVAAILYCWTAIIHSIKHHINVASKIFVQTIFASVFVVIIDFVMGYSGWAVNYVVPNLFSIANISVLIIIIVNRMDWHNYALYQVSIGVFGFIPIVLFLFGVIDRPLTTIIATVISVLTLLFAFIFGDKSVKSELKRRFHF